MIIRKRRKQGAPVGVRNADKLAACIRRAGHGTDHVKSSMKLQAALGSSGLWSKSKSAFCKSKQSDRAVAVPAGQITDQEVHRLRSTDRSSGKAYIPAFQPQARPHWEPSYVRFGGTGPVR